METARASAVTPGTAFGRTTVAFWALELGTILCLIALYKRGDRPFRSFVIAPAGLYLLLGATIVIGSGLLIARELRTPEARRQVGAAALLNAWSVLLVVVTSEAVVRALSVQTPAAPMFGRLLLLPKSWPGAAAHARGVLSRAASQGSFIVFDRELGWTVGPSRQSRDYNLEFTRRYLAEEQHASTTTVVPVTADQQADDSIYASSAEGIRSARAGVSFGGPTRRRRIALVGDSFTFGLEVRFDETWGNQLERALGGDYQVLNFGVDAYGVDQAVMRYRRDVTPWHPELVILGVISDDLRRTMCVYGFLCFVGFETPFPKPRFVVGDRGLTQLNAPLPSPDSLLGRPSITQLPFIADDGSYDPVEWETHPYQASYAVRLLLTRFRRWATLAPAVSDSALRRVNGDLFKEFVRMARANGSIPLILNFPSRTELLRDRPSRNLAEDVLLHAGVPYIDMTPCVRRVPPAERLVRLHYSARTNAAVAACLYDEIRARKLVR